MRERSKENGFVYIIAVIIAFLVLTDNYVIGIVR